MPEFGKQLRHLRQSSGMTQAEVAGHLNLSRSTVVQMERGNRRVTAEDVERLATLYRCSPSVMLSWRQDDHRDRDSDALAELVQDLADLLDDVFCLIRGANRIKMINTK